MVLDGGKVREDGGQEAVRARGIRWQRERPVEPIEDRLQHGQQADRS